MNATDIKELQDYLGKKYYKILIDLIKANQTAYKKLKFNYGEFIEWDDFRAQKIIKLYCEPYQQNFEIIDEIVIDKRDINEFTYYVIDEVNEEDDLLEIVKSENKNTRLFKDLFKLLSLTEQMIYLFIKNFSRLEPEETYKKLGVVDAHKTFKEIRRLYIKIK